MSVEADAIRSRLSRTTVCKSLPEFSGIKVGNYEKLCLQYIVLAQGRAAIDYFPGTAMFSCPTSKVSLSLHISH